MNKFVTSALALTVAGSAAYAGTGDSEWLELDKEISGLSSAWSTAQDGGLGWSALIRVTAAYSDDDLFTGLDAPPPGPEADDIFGFTFEDIDLAFWGGVGDYGWRVSGDLNAGILVLEDAYATWECGEYFTALLGSHKANVLRSNAVAPENLLFLNRTALGSAFDGWSSGIGASGDLEEMARWSISIQNGSNGTSADHVYVFRVEYDLGEGAGDAEGALGAGDELAATVGVTYLNDDSQDANPGGFMGHSDGGLIAIDAWGTVGPIGFGGEIADIDDDLLLLTDEDFFSTGIIGNGLFALPFSEDDPTVAAIPNAGGTTPFSLTLSYLINEELEAALRYEDLDNFLDTTILSLGVNWYQSGHNAKWHFGYSDVDNDSAPVASTFSYADGSIWQVGLTVGSSG